MNNPASAPLVAGVPAPDFALPLTSGTTATLADFAGRKLVLYFYPKDDTPGCTREAMDFNALKPRFEAAGCAVLGVSPDGLASHARFRQKHQLEIELAADPEKRMLTAYGVWVEKSMYGRKYKGVERTTVLIDARGILAQVWRKVKVPGHAEAVLKAMQALE